MGVRDRYDLVTQVGDYLLVYFLLGSDVTSGSTRGCSADLRLCRMSHSPTEIEYKLYNKLLKL